MVETFGVSCSNAVTAGQDGPWLADLQLSLFVVADGIGDGSAAATAARLTVDAIENFIRRSEDAADLSWPCGIDPALTFAGNRLRTAIYLANRRVFRYAETHDDYIGVGSSVVCALITGNQLVVGHVGDSRMYVWSAGGLAAVTRDDTWQATILAGGSANGMRVVNGRPQQQVLTNVLGARERAEIHIAERSLQPGEILLLCTDGVHDVLDSERLAAVMTISADPQQLAEAVVSAAVEQRTRDAVTALIVRYGRESGHHG